jgi:hypothetical protein
MVRPGALGSGTPPPGRTMHWTSDCKRTSQEFERKRVLVLVSRP